MINGGRVLAVVPARGGSKGLPGKNVREVCGKPLIAWSIEQGLASSYVDTVLVSTDSESIAATAVQYGAQVPFLRPASLAGDTASSVDVLLHAIDVLAGTGDVYDYVVLLEPTSPLRDVSDIDGALTRLVESGTAESIVGVARVEGAHPSFLFAVREGRLCPMSGSQPGGLRRQDLTEDYYYLEGTVYISRVASLRSRRTFYHDATAPWVVERYKAMEIDELSDLIAVEALMKARREGVLT